jgi:ribosomal protein L32
VLDIKCPDCGHLKVFHHVGSSSCVKESLSGCHFSIESKEDKWLECDCNKVY